MHLNIDADSLLYRAGFVCNEPDQERLACHQLDIIIKGILEATDCSSYTLYFTGGSNYRYKIYPEYKANRVAARPLHLKAMKAHAMERWVSVCSDGTEADDEVGIAQYAAEDEVAVAHIDKDIDMIEGKHYNFNKGIWYDVSARQAMRHFYYQLIMGDTADNIPGFDGKMRPKVPKFLQPQVDMLDECETTEEMFQHVTAMWGVTGLEGDNEERWHKFNQAAWCLWIQRKEFDDWRDYLNDNLMEELGLRVDLIRSLPAPYERQAAVGLQNTSV